MKNVEDLYPLTPVQQGMLLHGLSEPEDGTYVNQLSCDLRGELDHAAFRQAWDELVDRHSILRTAFIWEGVKQPLQVVRKKVELPWHDEDWRQLPASEQRQRLATLLDADRRRGFDPARAPLMRLTLIRLDDDLYRLVWTHSHLLLDGWSLALVMREVFALYEACRRGPLAQGMPRPRPYGDYIGWLKRRDPAQAAAFWQRLLNGFDEPTTIALPAPVGGHHNRGHRELRIRLSAADTAALEHLGRSHRLTLNTLVTGAWAVVLSRLSGSTDVAFGVIASGRPPDLEGAEEMVGLFINTLPLRLAVPPAETAIDWLEQVQELQVELRQYEHSPLVEVHRFSGVPQGSPLFESLYVFENYPRLADADEAEDASLVAENPLAIESTNYPLNVLAEPGEQLSLRSIYAVDRFDSTSVLRLLGHIRTVLVDLGRRAAAGELQDGRPQPCRLQDLAWLSDSERFQLLGEWNDTATAFDRERTLPQLFTARAARQGDAVAAVCGDAHLSYAALERRSRGLASRLGAGGVERGDLVAVHLERSLEMIPALLGILRAGAAYVPLEPGHPPARLSWILGAHAVRTVLTQSALARSLRDLDSAPEQLICLDRERFDGAAAEAAGPASDDLAYIIFTSGSTGHPKGVMVSHQPVINLIEWVQKSCAFSALDRVLFITSLGFDLSVFDVFGLLAYGGSIRVASGGEVRDPERLTRLLCGDRITFWDSAPAALQQLLPFLPPAEDNRHSALRLVFLSGDWIPLSMPRRLHASFPRAEVMALGGATEATVWSNSHRVGEIAPHWASIPYGRPIQNARYHVLDETLAPCPIGVAGDLYIGGECLALGYSRPFLTAERFIPDPVGGEAGARLYTTGDRARTLADGEIEFLGRLDHQVKIRGFRIELGEIEKALAEHKALQDVAVLARESGASPGEASSSETSSGNAVGREKRLVAYTVARPAHPAPTAAELRRHLSERLPESMIPSAFVALPALPVTANGKLDRQRLPAPEDVRALAEPSSETFAAPTSAVEEEVAKLWAEKLGVERVGIHDNFFELGGHSLLAVEIIGKLRRTLAPKLAITALFDDPTVAGLASAIAAERAAPTALEEASLPQIEPDPAALHQPFPLTDLQQAYWLGATGGFELGDLSPHIYSENEVATLDLERLERAIDRLIERHPMMRAVVTADGRQRVLESVPEYRIEVLDLSAASREEAEAAVLEIRRRMIAEGPPVDRWPLFEVRGTALPGGRMRLHASFSLLIADALSTKILFSELLRFYQEPEAELEPLQLAYRDYVSTLHQLRDGDLYRRSEAYWRRRLSELPPAMELPLAKDPATLERHHLVRRRGSLPRPAWERIKRRAAEVGVTPTVILCAAYAEVLATWSKTPRFTLNLLFLNRLPLHPQVTKIVGNCTSTILLEVDASPDRPFTERLKALQKRLFEDLEHIHFTGVQVLRELNRLRGSASRATMPVVFTSALNLNAPSAPQPTEDALETRPIYNSVQTPQVWIDHQTGEPEGGMLGFNWDTVDELFPAGMIETFFSTYCGFLEWLAAEDSDWSAVPSLTPAPQRALWQRTNAAAAQAPEPPSNAMLQTLFADRAVRQGDEPAVFAAGETVTYRELAALANDLGERLIELGGRPGKLIAVVIEKGWEQVAALLAILRAGAAYLPIDPSLPAERQRHLLQRGEVEIALARPGTATGDWDGVDTVTVGAGDLERVRTQRRPFRAADAAAFGERQRPEDLAYVIFTSGSTGEPKGVMIDHRGAVNTVVDVNHRFAVGPEDRVLALSALSFDLSVYDVFGLLAAGGAAVIPESDAAREPVRWLELLTRHRVTIWNSVPALMEMLVDHLEATDQSLPPSLRLVLLSGDWIPLTLPDRIRALAGEGAGELQLISLGGATEASIWSILYPIGEVDPSWASIPYGRPMAHQSFHVLDEALRPRAAWATGDLYIGGRGLARGYWRDEEKTGASFVFDPSSGERLYRTGDLGRYRHDGEIEFLGREDFQVKIQGYRIELGEIEATLLQHPAVRAAAVTARGERHGVKRLVAYVVGDASADAGADAGTLQAFLGRQLAAYMIPSAWVFLEALPLTSNGKVDRQALPSPEDVAAQETAPQGRTTFTSDSERQLTRLWQEVLEIDRVGVGDNFFELGGHSLAAVRLMGAIQRHFSVELPLSVLLEGATVEDLARRIEARQHAPGAGDGGARPALVRLQDGSRKPLFCVHPVGGNVFCYRELARQLGERPFYGLQTPDALPGTPAVEELAAHYLEQISTVDPDGPYLLSGWSMGGVIAFEMARQLERRGREVAFLGLIDAVVPEPEEPSEEALRAWFARDVAALSDEGSNPGALDEGPHLDPAYALFEANARALAAYRPGVLKGAATLLLADETRPEVAVPWRRLVLGGLEVHRLPGNHYTLLQPPQVARLAELLRARLETAPVTQERS